MPDLGRLYGRGISFPPRIGADGRIVWSEGPDNIRECIRIILQTEQRERLRLPTFGAGLRRLLFEPNTVATRSDISDRIQRSLAAWEPRITVEAVDVEEDPSDPQAAIATVQYRLIATQAKGEVSVAVQLAS